ncbi:unnamed protein product [Allacma fusca]|uniref:Uncharacterized protein n=1 Tax=Allacma fusca TaxID=39272 RepID=A0A8J2K714_9HEXA|nr:unnamed protein product [Allacma fusca]
MHSKHPQYGGSNYNNFYAIIHLSDPLVFNEFVQPGKFPKFGGACEFETGGPVTCGNSNVVVGCLAWTEHNCQKTEVAVFSMLPEAWFNEQIKEATKKCRVSPTTPPPKDCCNNGDTINGDPVKNFSGKAFIWQVPRYATNSDSLFNFETSKHRKA